jgi:alkylation response protein AidB-like acyl-CoA dehydrogenase
VQAGGPLSEKEGYTYKLIVPHAVALEASRAAIEETAERLDAGEGQLNVEGAVAKYLATEAGDAAADAAIQAHGGYGYTHDYMVEKIKRDVRITRIYEGTSEIMEITIARGRWQEHLKSGSTYYQGKARELEELHAERPGLGADVVALAHQALAELLEQCRRERLTRHQHVLLRLGSVIAQVEGAAALVRRARRAADKELNPKASRRLRAAALAAASRVYARGAALTVATEGVRLVAGADGQLGELETHLDLASINRAQGGLLADLDSVREAVYGRMRP